MLVLTVEFQVMSWLESGEWLCAAIIWEEVVERCNLQTVECNQKFLSCRIRAFDVAIHVCGRL